MSDIDNENSNILYDINTYAKWTSEKNLSKEINIYANYQKSRINNYNYLLKFGSWFKNKWFSSNNVNTLKFLFTSSKPWNETKLAVSNSGYIAVLQENFIEFYENLSDLVWRIEITTQFVGICNIFFNKREDMLLFTNEYGTIYFFDLRDGSEILKYDEALSIEFENSICKLFFIDKDLIIMRNLSNSSSEIIELIFSITYFGYFNVYTVHADKSINKIYTQSLLNVAKNGVYCAEMDSTNQYLVVGGFVSNMYTNSKQSLNGIFIWRILNGDPWLKHVEITNEIDKYRFKETNKSAGKMNFSKIEYVTKLQISSDNSSLVAIYISGKIAIYSLPSLKLINEWFMTEQPCYNEMNSEIVESPSELKLFKQIYKDADYRVVDIGWWSNKVLILTRGTGLLSLVSATNLSNLMGHNHQWVTPFASLYPYTNNEFIILNCNCSFAASNIHDYDEDNFMNDDTNVNDSNQSEFNNNQENEEDDEDDSSWYFYTKQILRSQAYNLIGLERFKPKPKKPKILKRKYALLHIKSTTPEELFQRKLNLEEYGEALQLAKSYNLDTDLVYQKQWRLKPISKSTIMDYLSKIKKRSWILHECEERLSPNIDTTKYLIDFGLHGTDLDSLIAIKEKDDNRFVYSKSIMLKVNEDDDDDFEADNNDIFNSQYLNKRKQKLEEIRNQKLKYVNIDNLTLMQKELLMCRKRLLNYMDRLTLYEQILGGPRKAADLFDVEKYSQIRSKPILEVAFDYARESNPYAVEMIFSYFDDQLKNNQLEVLNNFPETLEPEKYAKLLPKIENDQVYIFNEPEKLRDDPNWIEMPQFQKILRENEKEDETVHQIEYTAEIIQNWYYERTLEIEKFSGLVDVALDFAELAIVNGCKNMTSLVENLRILSTLTYECRKTNSNNNTETFYTLDFISELNDLEKLMLIMSHSYASNSEMYMKNLQDWLLPFISRRSTVNQREKLLREYLLKVSIDDLMPCMKLLNLYLKLLSLQSNPTTQSYLTLFQDTNFISILIDCLYESEKAEQVDVCHQIVNEITKSNETNATTGKQSTSSQQGQNVKIRLTPQQQQKIKLIQDHLSACEIFRKYGVSKTLSYIQNTCLNEENCRSALTMLTCYANKRTTHMKMNEWIGLMNDLESLQKNLYKNLISYQECREIFLTSLLGSRNLDNIDLAADWLRDIYIIDKLAAVTLSVKSVQEYFNSSSSYLDLDMNFAKECLSSIKSLILNHYNNHNNRGVNPKKSINELKELDPIVDKCITLINQEEDLIMAMKIIAEFDYNILPVQVRSNATPIDIIRDMLKKNENSYKDFEKFLTLAGYLNHLDTKNGKSIYEQANVMLLIAEHSLAKNNLYVLQQMCKHLLKLNYGPAWSCIYQLAHHLCKNIADQFKIQLVSNANIFHLVAGHSFDFNSISSTIYGSKEKTLANFSEIEKLLSFSLTHCSSSKIEEILGEKMAVERARDKLEKIIKNNLAKLDSSDDKKLKFDLLSSDYFNSAKSIEFDYETFRNANLQMRNLIDNLLEMKKAHINNGKFFQSLNTLIKLDANIALGYLLELDETNLEILLDTDSYAFQTTISYEFFLFLFGLNLTRTLVDNIDDLNIKEYFYLTKPSSLNKFLQVLEPTNLDNDVDIAAIDKNENNSFKIYEKISKLYTEFNQNNSLKDLNAGIDLKRFETDQAYKNETILGLSLDVNTFELACSLAKFYSFDLWKVYMSFTEYLLTENESINYDLTQVEYKIKPLLNVLKNKSDLFVKTMYNNVFVLIDGKDFDKLILFYSLLGNETNELHVKILKKLKSLSLNLFDYKELLERPLDTIGQYLTETNLQFFAKLLPKLPVNNKNLKLNSSKIHVLWCLKKIWPDESDSNEKNEISEWSQEKLNKFLDNFESLNDNIKKLDMESDFMCFVKELNLNRTSVYKLNVTVRKDLIKRILKLLKQNNQKLEENNLERLTKEITKISNHLKTIESVEKLFKQDMKQERGLEFIKKIDLILGECLINQQFNLSNEETQIDSTENDSRIGKLNDLLVEIFFDGFSIEILNSLIDIFEINQSTNIKKLIKLCLNKLSCDLKKHSDVDVSKLKIMLETISNHLNRNVNESETESQQQSSNKKKKNSQSKQQHQQHQVNSLKLINEEDVMECMRSFCNDQQIDLNTRLLILEDLKDTIKNIKDEDLVLLLVYKTNAILEHCDRFEKKVDLIEAKMIENETERLSLINKLIQIASVHQKVDFYLAIVKILNVWPQFTTTIQNEEKPWLKVLIDLLDKNYDFIDLVRDLIKKSFINESELTFIREKLEANQTKWNDMTSFNKLNYLKLLFLFRNFKASKEFISKLNMEISSDVNDDFVDDMTNDDMGKQVEVILNDKDLMSLILNEKFYLEIINTKFYALFTSYLIRNETKPIIYGVIRELHKSEYLEEAAKIISQVDSFFEPYRTLSVSLTLVNKFS